MPPSSTAVTAPIGTSSCPAYWQGFDEGTYLAWQVAVIEPNAMMVKTSDAPQARGCWVSTWVFLSLAMQKAESQWQIIGQFHAPQAGTGKSIEHLLCDHVPCMPPRCLLHELQCSVRNSCPHLHKEATNKPALYRPSATPTRSPGLANMASVTQRELCLPEVVKGTQPRAQAKPKLLGP